MNPKSNLAPDSSSIGGRVRSKKHRIEVIPPESMDSSDSFLDLTAEVGDLGLAKMEGASPIVGGSRFSSVGPLSSIGVEEVATWREKYSLSEDVIIRIPGPVDRVSDIEVDEIPVYEGFFESGFRYRVPSLVAKISEAFEISLGQLNPPAWRTQIPLKNLGDLEGLVNGVAEILSYYFVSPLNSGEGRYNLHPRSKVPLIHEIPKKERKRHPGFEGRWTEKFGFMHLPGFSPVWRAADTLHLDLSLAKKTIERILELSPERRQVPYLVSREVLERCSIWGNMSGSKGDEALGEYKKALEVMSAKKLLLTGLPPLIRTTMCCSSGAASPTSSCDMAAVLANLNAKVFPMTHVLLASKDDSSLAIQSLQGELLWVMSQLHHLRDSMEGQSLFKADLDALTSQLRE
ncbi:hypothetical protein F2Q69_00006871 [Brassica cretica]|uniref:Uncharacterized protein n=1 Tax=Brassica cretica TaxID=69181 RepID=A0A8S9NN29_BRACR|nr:hypothetical protein F2Q69_00006871 [Brassica cretica]